MRGVAVAGLGVVTMVAAMLALSSALAPRVDPLPDPMKTIGAWMIFVATFFATAIVPIWASAILTLGKRMRRKGGSGWLETFGGLALVWNLAGLLLFFLLHPDPRGILIERDPPFLVEFTGTKSLWDRLRPHLGSPDET